MAEKKPELPVTPAGLSGSGLLLWNSVVADFELDEHELAILREACRTVNGIDALQARVDRDGVLNESPQGLRVHPGLVELRQQRLALTKLLAALAIPADEAASGAGRRYGIRGAVS
ncbi:terminase [Mycolicibacterium wolinskyi]|uniref:terminase n=1 Tax=Mycolicibacterium wolinskyi TaxID=59750 RepID=UPI003917B0D5